MFHILPTVAGLIEKSSAYFSRMSFPFSLKKVSDPFISSLGWLLVVIASLGIFIGGALWSWCYVRYKSIWPGYVSHAIVDIAIFTIGYHLIFQ